ncbi:hypothetical protein ACPPVW_18705 [Leifsonia sp. McL0607]|uniref:hypothetical protein n=1 Tax=Leifsonia sp. McL0607 TaxID=3415672 RepID=UPI003CEB5D21
METIGQMVEGGAGLHDRALSRRFAQAISQYVAGPMIHTALTRLGAPQFDRLDAVNLVLTQLAAEAEHDVRRCADGRKPVLPRILNADDPIAYLIRAACKVPTAGSKKPGAQIAGWVFARVTEAHPAIPKDSLVERVDSLDERVDAGWQREASAIAGGEEREWKELTAHLLDLILPETPPHLWASITPLIDWCVSAVPLVTPSHQKTAKFTWANRALHAVELFPDLSADQIEAVVQLLWGTTEGFDGSLIGYVAEVRNAHQYGQHNRLTVFGKHVRDRRSECLGCRTTPLQAKQLSALGEIYPSRISKPVSVAA